jgi:hypothetical protein
MYLHLGGSTVVALKNIIAIIKINGYNSKINSNFIKTGKFNNNIINLSSEEDEPKSCIITDDNLYLSSVSALTLLKRNNEILQQNK